jgi:hypothetical protein
VGCPPADLVASHISRFETVRSSLWPSSLEIDDTEEIEDILCCGVIARFSTLVQIQVEAYMLTLEMFSKPFEYLTKYHNLPINASAWNTRSNAFSSEAQLLKVFNVPWS